jgi:fatty acid desaturase
MSLRTYFISFVQWWEGIQESKTNRKWLGHGLNIAAIIYIGALVIYLQIWTFDLDWGSLFPDIILVLFIYLLSVIFFLHPGILPYPPAKHATLPKKDNGRAILDGHLFNGLGSRGAYSIFVG